MKRVLGILASYCLASLSAWAQVPNDFDGDGTSDISRVTVGSDKSLTWQAQLSSTGAALELGAIGSLGDSLTFAAWSAGSPQPGIVTEDSASKTLLWEVLNPDKTRTQRAFGKTGDLAVSGGDFNGDGRADAAVVRLSKGKAEWEVSYNLFDNSGAPSSEAVTFGKSGDRVFYVRLEPLGVDWIGVVGKGRSGRSLARIKNLVTGEVRQFGRLPRFASTGVRPRPFAIRQAAGADLLGFEIAGNDSTTVKAYSLEGGLVYSAMFEGEGVSVVGDFTSGPGFEVAFQGERESAVVNPAQGVVQEATFLGGIAVDPINVNVVGVADTTPVKDDPPTKDPGSEGKGDGIARQCSQIRSWPGSHIYKTVGSDHFTDIRRNTIGVILKLGARGPFPDCIAALDSKGNEVAALGLYQTGFGWAARYYAGHGCGVSTPLNGSALASAASRKTGSSKIYMKFGDVCYGPIEANRCLNSLSC